MQQNYLIAGKFADGISLLRVVLNLPEQFALNESLMDLHNLLLATRTDSHKHDGAALPPRFSLLFIGAGLAIGFVAQILMPLFRVEIATQSIAGFSDHCRRAPTPHRGCRPIA